MTTEVSEFVAELDGGVFEGKLSRVLSDVAAACIDTDKKGKVTLTLDMARIGSSYQVSVKHSLKFQRPTKRGSVTEEDTTSTPMHVGERGKMSLFPDKQDQLFDKLGGISEQALNGRDATNNLEQGM